MVQLDPDARYDVVLADVLEIPLTDNPLVGAAFSELQLNARSLPKQQLQCPVTLKMPSRLEAITFYARCDSLKTIVTMALVNRSLYHINGDVRYYSCFDGVYGTQFYVTADSGLQTYSVPIGAQMPPGEYMLLIYFENSIPTLTGFYADHFYTALSNTGYALLYTENALGEGAISTVASPNFDLVFSESETLNVTQMLGVTLKETNALGYNVNWQSPFAGQLGSGQVREQDLTQYKVLTQTNLQGGRGLETCYEQPTTRYRKALADTRFKNMAVLPPRSIRTKSIASGPSFVPSDAVTNVQPQTIKALYGTKILDVPQFLNTTANVVQSEGMGLDVAGKQRKVKAVYEATEYARYLPGDKEQQSTTTAKAYLSYTISDAVLVDPVDGVFNDTNITSYNHIVDNGTWATTSTWRETETDTDEYSGEARKIRYVSLYIRVLNKGAFGRAILEVRDDGWNPHASNLGLGYPGSTIYATGIFDLPDASSQFAWVVVELDAEVSLEQLTKYWLVLRTYGDGTQLYWRALDGNRRGKSEYSTNSGGSWYDYTLGGSVSSRTCMYKLSDGKRYTNAAGADQEMSFKVGSNDIHCGWVRLRLKRESWGGQLKGKIKVMSDVGGAPGGEIYSWDFDDFHVSTSMNWVYFYFTSAQTFTANLTYHVVLSMAGEKTAWGQDVGSILWECDSAMKYLDGNGQQNVMAGGSLTAWASNNRDFYFAVENSVLVKRRFAQSFPAGADAVTLSKLQFWMKLDQDSDWIGNATVSVSLYADVDDAPSGSALATGALAKASVPVGTVGKVAVTMSAYALNPTTTYQVVIEASAPGAGDGVILTILNDANSQYAGGAALYADYVGSWGAWTNGYADIFFIVNNGPQSAGGALGKVRGIQSFPLANTTTVTKVAIMVSLVSALGSPTVTLSICADSAGAPGAVQRSASISVSSIPIQQGWISVALTSISLAAGTYWIVVEADASTSASGIEMYWYTDLSNSYADGVGKIATYASGAWGAYQTSSDFFFMVNDGQSFSGTIGVRPVTFNSGFWLAVGIIIYKFDKTTQAWVQQASLSAGADVTAMAEHAGKLYVARGDSTDMQSSADGVTWAAVTNRKYTYLLNYNKYLYALKAAAGANALGYFSGDTSVWADITFGTSAIVMTWLVGYVDSVLLFSTTGMYELSSSYVVQTLDWSQQRNIGNGKGSLVWGADNQLYIPIRNSLNAYNGSGMTSVGLDQDEGLPSGQQGPVAMMSWTVSWLFAVIDAGVSGTSGVYAKVAGGGWHCVALADVAGQRSTVVAIESVTDAAGLPRLWFNEAGAMYYVPMPDLSDNPYTYTGSQYQNYGWIEGSWWLGELSGIDKDFQSVIIRSEGCNTSQTIEVQLGFDRSGQWWPVGTVTRSPMQEFVLSAALMANKITASGCTDTQIVVDETSTLSDLSAGSFIRIGREVRQVISVDSETQFTLNRPLEDGAPTAGELVISSRPAGREVCYRLVLRTTDPTKTPKLLSTSIRYMEQLIDKAKITLSIAVGSCEGWRSGATSSISGAQLYEQLVEYGRRLTPFWLIGPDGLTHRVKNAGSMTWSNVTRTSEPNQARTVKGTLNMVLVEV